MPVGGTVQLSSTGWTAGGKVDVAIHSDPVSLGQLTADASGAATGSFVLPVGSPRLAHDHGDRHVSVGCHGHGVRAGGGDGRQHDADERIGRLDTVIEHELGSGSDSSLAFTGGSVLPLVLFASDVP